MNWNLPAVVSLFVSLLIGTRRSAGPPTARLLRLIATMEQSKKHVDGHASRQAAADTRCDNYNCPERSSSKPIERHLR